MIYKVVITAQAMEEFNSAFAWLLARTEQHAPAWYGRVIDSINSLEQFPTRCPLAPENSEFDVEIRHLIVGDRLHAYRIVFEIRDATVVVVDFVHGARDRG